MKMIKSVLTAAMIAASMGTMLGAVPYAAIAAESAEGVNKAIADTKKALAEAIQIAAEGTNQEALVNKIAEAKQYYKEITGDQYGAKLQRLSGSLSKARGMAKRGDLAGAEEELKRALEIVNQFPPS
ncbi:MAG: hypothetical protein ACK4JF_05155 [Methylohalobius sp.]